MSMCRTPSGWSALHTAFIVALSAPTVPASPTPLTPSGFSAVGVWREVGFKLGRYVDVGWYERSLP